MTTQDIESAVFTRVRKAPFGASLLPSLTPREIREAAVGFISKLSKDPRLSEQLTATNAGSLQYINALIHASIKGRSPIVLSGDDLRVLVVLAHLIIGGRLFPERASALESLGSEIKSLPHTPDIPEAAECLLNAAYLCKDPDVKIAAGRYYLEILDAEVGTALAYFTAATEINFSCSCVEACDKLLARFLETRAIFYPFRQLEPYIDAWKKHKQALARPF
jgi:hypothetical protein